MEPWIIDLLSQDGYRNSRKPEASIEEGCLCGRITKPNATF